MINVESHYFRIHPKRFINGKTIHFPALITKAAYSLTPLSEQFDISE